MLRSLFACALCLIIFSPIARAQSFISECAASLVLDKTVINSNFLAGFTYLQQVDTANFEEIKKKQDLSVLLGDYTFNGNFSDFSRRRSYLNRLVQASSKIEVSTEFTQYALSRSGAQSFSDCIAKLSRRPLNAFVEVVDRDIVIFGVVKTETTQTASKDTLTIVATGGEEVPSGNHTFINNVETGFTFKRKKGEPFTANLNLMRGGSPVGHAEVFVPAYQRVRLDRKFYEVNSPAVSVVCGGNGSADSKDSSPTTLTARPDRRLDLSRLTPIPEVTPGPGEGDAIASASMVGTPTDTQAQAIAHCGVKDKNKAGRVSVHINGYEIEEVLTVDQ